MMHQSISCLSSLVAVGRYSKSSSSSGLHLSFQYYTRLHSKHTRMTNFGEKRRLQVLGKQLSSIVFESPLNVAASPVQCQRTFMTSMRAMQPKPYNTSGNVRADTLVFAHKNDAFYKMLSYFGIFQLGMWSYLSLFAFQQLKAVPVGLQDTSELPWYKKLLYKQGQYKNALSLLSLIVGGVVFFITVTYPRRVVKALWLLKGGDQVKIMTYSWLGKVRTFTAPLEDLSCNEARSGKGHHIPMKVKDNNFYFIIDKQGSFPKTDLFDYVVGVKRKL